MQQPTSIPAPKSVDVNITSGSGMDIEWQDGHRSSYGFSYLRDACPCALCDEQREQDGRVPGEPQKPAPGSLPMFKEPPKPTGAKAVGHYAINFTWRDGHQHGIYSWDYLRAICPCQGCCSNREHS